MNRKKVIHLYSRFGFGLNAKELAQLRSISFSEKLASEKIIPLKIDLSALKNIHPKSLSQMNKKSLRKELKGKVTELNVHWLNEMISSDNFIREKMSLFWHHHFACIIKNPLFAQQFSNIIRTHATGSFKTLLIELSQSAAMIDFLHTKQNRKSAPNEDFARELCELFTLGRDNEYTEKDIAEIAKCFTGWNHEFDGTFIIKTRQHNNGRKTIFGERGNFGGEDVINLILKKEACARFICENIYQYFVNPSINVQHIEELAQVFYESNYNIQTLITHIADSDWFYAEENILSKIKSPIEFIVGLSRLFKIKSDTPKSWMILQNIFDQVLYQPPNVQGWKVNQEWINSNSLPLRLRLPSIILSDAKLEIETKPDYDSNPNDGRMKNPISRRLDFSHDWAYFFRINKNIDLKELLFNNKLSPQIKKFLSNRKFKSKEEELIQLISLPEFQLA